MLVKIALVLVATGAYFASNAVAVSEPYVVHGPPSDLCCLIPHLMKQHLFFKYMFQTQDPLSFDADYYCDHLSYAITQLLYLHTHIEDSSVIADVITQLVAKHVLQTQGKTSLAAFNNLFLTSFRLKWRSLVEDKNTGSVKSILASCLHHLNLPKTLSNNIMRKVIYRLRDVYFTKVTSAIEKYELEDTMNNLEKLRQRVQTIVNGTSLSTIRKDGSLGHIKAAIKEALVNAAQQQMTTFKLRALYLVFLKSVISHADVKDAVDDVRFILENIPVKGGMSASQVSSVTSSSESALNQIHQYLSSFVSSVESRNKAHLVSLLAGPLIQANGGGHSTASSYVSKLIDKIAWMKENIPQNPQVLREQYDRLLKTMNNFIQDLKGKSKSAQEHNAKQVSFMKTVSERLQSEFKMAGW